MNQPPSILGQQYQTDIHWFWYCSTPPPELFAALDDGWLDVPRRVLDLGCGLGTELGHLANHGVALTVGVDRSIAALVVALFANASQAGGAGLGAVARWREKHVHQR